MWLDLIEAYSTKFPQTVFVLLGRIQDKPLTLLRFKNVVAPRVLGFTLAHELALLSLADLILSSNHGFAAAAFFTRQQKCKEAFKEIQHELLLNPSDQTALSLRTHIWSELNRAR